MNKLKQKIAALLTVGIGIVPNVSFNVVKANNILQKDAFLENFQKKDITVYKTNDNLLVDANLNYINADGKILGKNDEKISVADELKNNIDLHPILMFLNNHKDEIIFTKSECDDGKSHIFTKTREQGTLKMLYFSCEFGTLAYTDKPDVLTRNDVVNKFGNAVPELDKPEESEKNNLLNKLALEADSIKNKNKENKIVNTNTSDDKCDSCIATVVTGAIGLGILGYIFSNLSEDGVVNLD